MHFAGQNGYRNLPVKFTEDQLLKLGNELASKLYELSAVEREKEATAKHYKARIETIEGEVGHLQRCVHDKYETREVECKIRLDWPTRGTKTVFRLDTGENVSEEMMTPADRQMLLDWQARQKAEEEKAAAQEKPAVEVPAETEPEQPKLAEADPNTIIVMAPGGEILQEFTPDEAEAANTYAENCRENGVEVRVGTMADFRTPPPEETGVGEAAAGPAEGGEGGAAAGAEPEAAQEEERPADEPAADGAEVS